MQKKKPTVNTLAQIDPVCSPRVKSEKVKKIKFT